MSVPVARKVVLALVAAVTMVFAGLLVAPTASGAVAAGSSTDAGFRLKTFHTPSGNIQCALLKSGGRWSARCDTYQHNWSPPARYCPEGDNAGSVAMGGKSRSGFICVSDAISPPGKTLKYGRSLSFGPYYCKSKPSGLKCWNRRAHGWFLSRESYSLW